jgi:hypothetical protein
MLLPVLTVLRRFAAGRAVTAGKPLPSLQEHSSRH